MMQYILFICFSFGLFEWLNRVWGPDGAASASFKLGFLINSPT